MKKNISVIGSTGSIGRQTLDVAALFPQHYNIIGLAAGKDWETLLAQINRFHPQEVSIADPDGYQKLKEHLSAKTVVHYDQTQRIASLADCHMAVIATVGISGLKPVLAALERKIPVALATKEALVAAGDMVMKLAAACQCPILPIDSEHCAVFQCLGNQREFLSKIILTASGGPFRGMQNLENVTLAQTLNHPTWQMGKKITVDSATMMNKGFEVIEAKHLFQVDAQQIEVIVHPQSIVHSMVEFCDGSVIAQMSPPDMRQAIQYCLSYPNRPKKKWQELKLWEIACLTFEKPNTNTFPCT